jgi:hypothetical protein
MIDSFSPKTGLQNSTPRRTLRILLVVNPPESLSGLSLGTCHEGFEVKCAHGSPEAIDLLNRYQFDLLLREFRTSVKSSRALLDWMSHHPSVMLISMTTSGIREEDFWVKIRPYLVDLLNARVLMRGLSSCSKKTDVRQSRIVGYC